MAASPVSSVPVHTSSVRRRAIVLSQRRLEANRRNAARSTGPRTAEGKARVARNPIKHGFFAARERWTPQQLRDFEETLAGLRDEFKPQDTLEESRVGIIADSYVRMAASLRYENIAAFKYHQQRERELNERIARAAAPEAAHLRAERDALRHAGLWRPTIPAPREAMAISRYQGSLDRSIRRALEELAGLRTHREASPSGVLSAARRTSNGAPRIAGAQKQTHFEASPEVVLRLPKNLEWRHPPK